MNKSDGNAVLKAHTHIKDWCEFLAELQSTCGYSEQDAMLVLKDILAHEYMDNRKK